MFGFNALKKNILSLNRWTLFLVLLVSLYRIYGCFQVPDTTTDVLRHLGYSSHALENFFSIYTTKAKDFSPEFWTALPWSDQTYIYPPVTLIFFCFFSTFHLGIFWVKLTLTFIDCGCAYLFYRYVSKFAAILYFCAPISLWYTSHQGQFEVLQALFIILNVISIKKRQWLLSGLLFALSIQVKQFGVLILPWMLYEIWKKSKEDSQKFINIICKAIQGLLLGFLVFLPFYIQTPWLLLSPITSGSNLTFNPFAWNLFNSDLFAKNPKLLNIWNAFFSYSPLLILAFLGVFSWKKRKFNVIVSTIPLASFWFIIKSLKWAQSWYPIVSPSFLFCLSQKSLIHLLLLLHLMQCLNSTASILVGKRLYREPPSNIELMQSCMFKCDPQRNFNISDLPLIKLT